MEQKMSMLKPCQCGRQPELVEFVGYAGFAVECPGCGWKGRKFGAHLMPEGIPNPDLWRQAAVDSWNRGEVCEP